MIVPPTGTVNLPLPSALPAPPAQVPLPLLLLPPLLPLLPHQLVQRLLMVPAVEPTNILALVSSKRMVTLVNAALSMDSVARVPFTVELAVKLASESVA